MKRVCMMFAAFLFLFGMVTQAAQESKEPILSAVKAFMLVLYGSDHPYGQPITGSGTESSMKAITRTDLEKFYKANYIPGNLWPKWSGR